MIPPTGAHPPGSFTKSFAWHGKGLLALHTGIRAGFAGKLVSTSRDSWRAACGLDDTRFLVAANFFMFNVIERGRNRIPVDEFARQAIQEPHSAAFDRLGHRLINRIQMREAASLMRAR